MQQISEGKDLIASLKNEAFALIIDGKSLAYALEDDLKKMFLDLAVECSSVICCRSSPKQKALVSSQLYKKYLVSQNTSSNLQANQVYFLLKVQFYK